MVKQYQQACGEYTEDLCINYTSNCLLNLLPVMIMNLSEYTMAATLFFVSIT